MKIGITYDLKKEYLLQGFSEEETAEFDKEETIEAIETSLKNLGHQTERIGNIKNLIKYLNSGKTCDLVFNIAEGLYGISREAQIPALLDAYKIPYTFSDPLVLSLTLHKGLTKKIIKYAGIPTAHFEIIEKLSDIDKINIQYPLFAKPIAEGTSKGIDSSSKTHSKEQLYNVCKNLLEKFKQPVLVEKFLPGREFTIGIIGTGENSYSIGIMEINIRENAKHDAYSYFNKQNYKELITYTTPEPDIAKICEDTALEAWKVLKCRDAGRIDLRMDENGTPNFIEVNPLAGLHPIDSDLVIISKMKNITYQELIRRIMESVKERL